MQMQVLLQKNQEDYYKAVKKLRTAGLVGKETSTGFMIPMTRHSRSIDTDRYEIPKELLPMGNRLRFSIKIEEEGGKESEVTQLVADENGRPMYAFHESGSSQLTHALYQANESAVTMELTQGDDGKYVVDLVHHTWRRDGRTVYLHHSKMFEGALVPHAEDALPPQLMKYAELWDAGWEKVHCVGCSHIHFGVSPSGTLHMAKKKIQPTAPKREPKQATERRESVPTQEGVTALANEVTIREEEWGDHPFPAKPVPSTPYAMPYNGTAELKDYAYSVNWDAKAVQRLKDRIRELGLNPHQADVLCEMPEASTRRLMLGNAKAIVIGKLEKLERGLDMDYSDLRSTLHPTNPQVIAMTKKNLKRFAPAETEVGPEKPKAETEGVIFEVMKEVSVNHDGTFPPLIPPKRPKPAPEKPDAHASPTDILPRLNGAWGAFGGVLNEAKGLLRLNESVIRDLTQENERLVDRCLALVESSTALKQSHHDFFGQLTDHEIHRLRKYLKFIRSEDDPA